MKRHTYPASAEVKILTVREAPVDQPTFDTPDRVAEFFSSSVTTAPWFDPMKECCVVFMLNSRKKLMCWNLVTLGIVSEVQYHPREIFRPAIVACASSIIIAHNHPSGDPSPSDSDVKMTRDLVRAGQLLKIDLLDHVIIGHGKRSSMRELGHVY